MTEFNIETGEVMKDRRNPRLRYRGSLNEPGKRHNLIEVENRFEKKTKIYEQKIHDLQECLKRLPLNEKDMTPAQLERKRRIEAKLKECETAFAKCVSRKEYLDTMIEHDHINLFNQPVKQGKHKTKLSTQNLLYY